MDGIDEEIENHLRSYYALKEQRDGKVIRDEIYKERKEKIVGRLRGLLDKKIKKLEGEKEGLVFELSHLDERHQEGVISEDRYNKEHGTIQTRIFEIEPELRYLRAGRDNIERLRHKEPQLVILRSHAAVFLIIVFAIFSIYLFSTGKLSAAILEESITRVVKSPTRGQSGGELLRGGGGAAVFFGDVAMAEGFYIIKPVPGTANLTEDGMFTGVFSKPQFHIVVTGIKASNAITSRLCEGPVYVNGIGMADKGVGIPQEDMGFTVNVTGCQDIYLSGEFSELRITLDYDTILGDTRTKHISQGTIRFYAKD